MIKNTLTAVISNTMEYFHHWARERRIRPMKGSNKWIDMMGDEYIPIIADNWFSRFKLAGIRINDVEDITYEYNDKVAELLDYCKSRIAIYNRSSNYMSLKKSISERKVVTTYMKEMMRGDVEKVLSCSYSKYTKEDFQKSEMFIAIDYGVGPNDWQTEVVAIMKDGVIHILEIKQDKK